MSDIFKLYGFNILIRRHIHFPSFLTLPCVIQHGWYSSHIETDLRSEYPMMLVFSRRNYNDWKQISNKPVFISGAPFVLYKEKYNIETKKSAKGTIAFPLHSTDHVKSLYDVEKYCEQLIHLPKDFHPITVSLHHVDIDEGKAKIYEKYGISVVTAGDSRSPNFASRLYDNLTNHKYMTSNGVGTHLFYGVDLGMPFFITGDVPIFKNDGEDLNEPMEYCVTEIDIYQRVHNLFNTGPTNVLSEMQKQFVAEELGVNDRHSSLMLSLNIWIAYFKYIFGSFILGLKKGIRIFYFKLNESVLHLKKYLAQNIYERIADKLFLIKLGLNANLDSSFSLKEKKKIYSLVRNLKNGNLNVVEIGSRNGAVSSFIASALGRFGHLIALDYLDFDLRDNATLSCSVELFFTNTLKYKAKIKRFIGLFSEIHVPIQDDLKRVDILCVSKDYDSFVLEQILFFWIPKLSDSCILVLKNDKKDSGLSPLLENLIAIDRFTLERFSEIFILRK